MRRNASEEILFHHRFPTSTENVRNACHPFSTKDYFGKTQYVMVHNGWLTNQAELKLDHVQQGISYVSTQPDGRFNDSEALMYDLALTFEGRQAKPRAEGVASFIMIERLNGEPIKLHFGRNSYPLNMVFDKNTLSLSSEGEGEPINEDTHYTYTYATGELAQEPLIIDDGYGYSYKSHAKGYTNSKGYAWEEDLPQGVGVDQYEDPLHYFSPRVKVAESVFQHGVATGDTVTTAADVLMECNLNYAEAKSYANSLVQKYSRWLAKTVTTGDLLHNPDAINANLNRQIEHGAKLEHWTEVELTLGEWEEMESPQTNNNVRTVNA